MLEQLVRALKEIGHVVEIIRLPFSYSSNSNIETAVRFFERFDFSRLDGGSADRVISLKFPAYYAKHENGTVWLMHQHRPFYELWNSDVDHSPAQIELKKEVISKDTIHLSQYKKIFTISKNVSKRLQLNNEVISEPIYQPPANENKLMCNDNLPVIFCPSRIEGLKRQELLIRAMSHVRSPVIAVISGTGGMENSLKTLAKDLNVADRILFTGEIDNSELLRYFGLCRAVFFAPFDEDYGFVTLEAMLASKPVITCVDSGGPLEFVQHGINGFVVQPDEWSVAEAISRLAEDPARSAAMGKNGLDIYRALNLSWHAIADRLAK